RSVTPASTIRPDRARRGHGPLERRPPGTCLRSGGSGRGGAGERRARAAGPSAEERVRGARRRIRPAALGAHARWPILPVQPAGAAVPTICRGTPPARGDVAVREPGHGLLGAAAAAGRARRDHLDSAGACLSPSARPPGWVAPSNRQVLTVVGPGRIVRVLSHRRGNVPMWSDIDS